MSIQNDVQYKRGLEGLGLIVEMRNLINLIIVKNGVIPWSSITVEEEGQYVNIFTDGQVIIYNIKSKLH